MKKLINLPKYIQKLKKAQLPQFAVGQENSLSHRGIVHPAYDANKKFPKDLQIAEFYGNMKEDHPYMSDDYNKLLVGLREYDNKYSGSSNLEQRVKLCKDSIMLWNQFTTSEYNKLPKDQYYISDSTLRGLKEIWDRFKVIMI